MGALCVIGTRPEAIKMIPVILELKSRRIHTTVLTTGQHDVTGELIQWGIVPDRELPIQRGTMECISRTSFAVRQLAKRAACIIAQGDTTTVFATANAAFLLGRPFVHIEAGLRTYDLKAPFPEEYYRRCISLATTLHCAPTYAAAANLKKEGFTERVIVTGNTVIDSLVMAINKAKPDRHTKNCVLLTSHRFENRKHKQAIIAAAVEISQHHRVVYVEHGNPKAVLKIPEYGNNIDCVSPRSYTAMASLLHGCKAILTDSGGLQEEACYLKKPTIVLRDSTERPEAVECGTAFMGGTDFRSIMVAFELAMSQIDEKGKLRHVKDTCPYGDGLAAKRIVDALRIFK